MTASTTSHQAVRQNTAPPTITLLTAFNWVRLSGPVRNAIAYLEQHQLPSRVFSDPDQISILPENDCFICETSVVHEHSNSYGRDSFLWKLLSKYSEPFSKYEKAFRFVLANIWRLKADLLIGFDPEGAVRAFLASKLLGRPYIVYSLEFWEEFPKNSIERQAFSSANLVVAPDAHRASILQKQYGLRDDQMDVLPNSDSGEFTPTRSDFLRSHCGIPADKIIVLCTGTLHKGHCTDKMIAAASTWSDNVVLVLHGWNLSKEDKLSIQKVNAEKPGKIYLSEDFATFDDKNKIFQSADVGVVAFSRQSFNHFHGAGSAGKLYGFSQAGVPMLVKNTPGMKEIVEGNNIGMLFDNFEGLDAMAVKLFNAREQYQAACKTFFENHEFGTRFSSILKRMNVRV